MFIEVEEERVMVVFSLLNENVASEGVNYLIYWNQLWTLRSHEVCLLVKSSTNTTCFILHLCHTFFSPTRHSYFILLHFASLIHPLLTLSNLVLCLFVKYACQ